MYARYVIFLSKFKLEEQLCFAAKLDIMHIHRLVTALNFIMKYIVDNKLNHYVRNEGYIIVIMK